MPARNRDHAIAVCRVMTATKSGDPAAIAAARLELERTKIDIQIAELADRAHMLAPRQVRALADLAAAQGVRPAEPIAA